MGVVWEIWIAREDSSRAGVGFRIIGWGCIKPSLGRIVTCGGIGGSRLVSSVAC